MARDYTALPFEYLEEMDYLSDAEYGRLIRALQLPKLLNLLIL